MRYNLSELIGKLWRRDDTTEEIPFSPTDTSQRHLDRVINEHLQPEQVKVKNLVHAMIAHEWENGEVLSATSRLIEFEERLVKIPSLANSLLRAIIENDALDPNDITDSSATLDLPDPSEPQTRDYRLELVLNSISAIELQKGEKPTWVYTKLWKNWFGNSDERRNALNYPLDVHQSAQQLQYANKLTKKARNLLLEVMDGFVPTRSRSYGMYTADLTKNLLLATDRTHPKAYGYCEAVFKAQANIPPRIYGSFLSLPKATTKGVDEFISRAITVLPSIEDKAKYLRYLGAITRSAAKMLRTEERRYIDHLFGKNKFTAENAQSVLKRQFQLLREVDRGGVVLDDRVKDLSQLVMQVDDVSHIVNHISYDFAGNLKDDPDKQKYFNWIINLMRDQLNPVELFVYADALYHHLKGDPLTSPQEKARDDIVARAMLRNTKRMQDQSKIQEVRKNTTRCPLHVADHYRKLIDIPLQPEMIDVGEDNGAWYSNPESVRWYFEAKAADFGDDGVNTRHLQSISRHLIRRGILRQSQISILGLACGWARPEIEFAKILEKKKTPEGAKFNATVYLCDKNRPMLESAGRNCPEIPNKYFLLEQDITDISYKSTIGTSNRQLIITLLGRTFFNMEEASHEVMEGITDIVVNHHQNGCKMPTVILIEGDKSKRMQYYTDPGAEKMHLMYVTNRLNTHPAAFSEGEGSTYAAILSPDGTKVEFYFLVTRDIPVARNDRDTHEFIPRGQVIRIGESRTIQPDLETYFNDRLFHYDEISDRSGSVMIVLTPDYSRMFRKTSTGSVRVASDVKDLLKKHGK